MTDTILDQQHEKPMCVRIWLEVGHECSARRSALGRSLPLDWRVWVRGVGGRDISAFVHKVVFHLHPPTEFVYPKRVLQEPPYEIQESGCASIDIPIHVYLKYSKKPKKLCLRYSLKISNSATNSSKSRCVYYDLENPPEELWQGLMSGGGEAIPGTGHRPPSRSLLLLLSSDTDDSAHLSDHVPEKCKFVEPIKYKNGGRRDRKISGKLDKATNLDLKRLLKGVAMTDNEIACVSQLYLSYSRYEKSSGALILPPLSDPIYRVPDLPLSLQGSLSSVESDYAMQ